MKIAKWALGIAAVLFMAVFLSAKFFFPHTFLIAFPNPQATVNAELSSVAASLKVSKKPEWQVHIDWSFNNSEGLGAVNCVWQYVINNEFGCYLGSGRSCVMADAQKLAKESETNIDRVFTLTQMTQCHNDEALATIIRATSAPVYGYVRSHR